MTRTRNDIPKAMMAAVLALLIAAAGIFTLLPHHLHHAALHRVCFALTPSGHPADTPCGGCEGHGLDIDGCGYRQPALRADSQSHDFSDVPVMQAMALCGGAAVPDISQTELHASPAGERPPFTPAPPYQAACALRAPPAGNDF